MKDWVAGEAVGAMKIFVIVMLFSFVFTPPPSATFAEQTAGEGDIEKAIAAMKASIETDPGNPEAHEKLGYLLLRNGKFDEALDSFRAALKITPRMRASKTGIGLAFLKKGELKEAEESLKDALVLNPYPSMTHYALGVVYERLNDYQQAMGEFKKGIETFKSGKK